MSQSQIQELIEYIQWLGEAAVNRGFELAMLEVRVLIAQQFVWLAVSLILMVVGALLARAGMRYERDGAWDDGQFPLALGSVIAGLIGALGFIVTLTELISYMMNPEWRAIELILEAVR